MKRIFLVVLLLNVFLVNRAASAQTQTPLSVPQSAGSYPVYCTAPTIVNYSVGLGSAFKKDVQSRAIPNTDYYAALVSADGSGVYQNIYVNDALRGMTVLRNEISQGKCPKKNGKNKKRKAKCPKAKKSQSVSYSLAFTPGQNNFYACTLGADFLMKFTNINDIDSQYIIPGIFSGIRPSDAFFNSGGYIHPAANDNIQLGCYAVTRSLYVNAIYVAIHNDLTKRGFTSINVEITSAKTGVVQQVVPTSDLYRGASIAAQGNPIEYSMAFHAGENNFLGCNVPYDIGLQIQAVKGGKIYRSSTINSLSLPGLLLVQ